MPTHLGRGGTYLFALEAQPGGPVGRPHTTAGSWPKRITGRPLHGTVSSGGGRRGRRSVNTVRFPEIPNVGDPRGIEGPGQMVKGRFAALPFLVPQVDADGNELAGIKVPEVTVPLSTTTGWNFRAERIGNPSTISALLGHRPGAVTPGKDQP